MKTGYLQAACFIKNDGTGIDELQKRLGDGFLVCHHIHLDGGVILMLETGLDPRHQEMMQTEGDGWKAGADYDDEE